MTQPTSRRDLLKLGAGAVAGGLAAATPVAVRADDDDVAAVPDLKITRVTTFHLECELERAFGASVSVPLDKTRTALLVKIETNAGHVGWGETSPISGAQATIDTVLGPKLIGQNPMEYRRLWRSLWGPNFGNGLATGAVDIALNDIRGKVLGLPVAEVFGGRFREKVPVYVSALDYVEGIPIEKYYPARAEKMIKQGHRAIKMRLGRFPVAREARVIKKIRKIVGPDVKLMADGNGAYTMGNALKMADHMADLDFEFLEEPMPQRSNNSPGYERLREKMPLPLAGGEAVDSRDAAHALLTRRAFDIIQPDASLCGGIGEVVFISELAYLSGTRCFPHCWGADIIIAATVHALSLVPDPHFGLPTDTPFLELDQSENPWREGLAKGQIEVKDGYVTVPRKPGLGIEVDEKLVRKYAV